MGTLVSGLREATLYGRDRNQTRLLCRLELLKEDMIVMIEWIIKLNAVTHIELGVSKKIMLTPSTQCRLCFNSATQMTDYAVMV